MRQRGKLAQHIGIHVRQRGKLAGTLIGWHRRPQVKLIQRVSAHGCRWRLLGAALCMPTGSHCAGRGGGGDFPQRTEARKEIGMHASPYRVPAGKPNGHLGHACLHQHAQGCLVLSRTKELLMQICSHPSTQGHAYKARMERPEIRQVAARIMACPSTGKQGEPPATHLPSRP